MADKPFAMITHVTELDGGESELLLKRKGHAVTVVRANKGEPLPAPETISGAALFGGPQSANDDHLDYVTAEYAWIERAMRAEIPLLGVCLGAQMIARALGATVAPHAEGAYEFGYFPIAPLNGASADLALEAPLMTFHRHGEAFTLPSGAEHLATRDVFPNQAFRHGRTTWGIQFHPEVNDTVLDRWLSVNPPDLERDGAQTVAEQRAGHAKNMADMHTWLSDFLDLWTASGA